jgi:hypothetical protein
MTKKILMIFIIIISLCSYGFAEINYQLSAGLQKYSESIGIDANFSLYFPFRLVNRDNADINPGIMLLGSYANVNELNVFSFGLGVDSGYIISINGFRIIPSAGMGYLWSIAAGADDIAGSGAMYVYPHVMLAIDFTPSMAAGLDAGYRIALLANEDSSGSGNSIVLNLTISLRSIDNKGEAIDGGKTESSATRADTDKKS